jgi:K+-sensing histidine kinase KdpD
MIDTETKLHAGIAEIGSTDPLNPQWMRYLAAVAMTAAATVVAVAVDTRVTIPNLSLVFVIPVIVAGLSLGLGPALAAAVLGALAFNFFLTEPRYSLAIDDPSNIWAMALLFVVGLIVSGVAFTSHRRAAEAALLRKQAGVLQACSRDLVSAGSMDAAASRASQALAALFDCPAVVMMFLDGKPILTRQAGGLDPAAADEEAALACLTSNSALRSGVYPHLASRYDFWPVRSEGRRAVIGLAFDPDERPANPDAHVEIVAGLLALALERQRSGGGAA